MLQNLSPIQNDILSKLKHATVLRYSELQPEDVANDLFNYHLQFLVKKEFVSRSQEGYSLSPIGIKYVADPFAGLTASTSLFKVNVITIVSSQCNGKLQILNQLRKSNPSYGKVGVMGGVVLKGETIVEAAKRKLKEETGLDAEFRLIGLERRMLHQSEGLFSDTIFPIAYADNSAGCLIAETIFGSNMWVPIEVAIKNESAEFDSIASIKTTLIAIQDDKILDLPFFFNESIQKD